MVFEFTFRDSERRSDGDEARSGKAGTKVYLALLRDSENQTSGDSKAVDSSRSRKTDPVKDRTSEQNKQNGTEKSDNRKEFEPGILKDDQGRPTRYAAQISTERPTVVEYRYKDADSQTPSTIVINGDFAWVPGKDGKSWYRFEHKDGQKNGAWVNPRRFDGTMGPTDTGEFTFKQDGKEAKKWTARGGIETIHADGSSCEVKNDLTLKVTHSNGTTFEVTYEANNKPDQFVETRQVSGKEETIRWQHKDPVNGSANNEWQSSSGEIRTNLHLTDKDEWCYTTADGNQHVVSSDGSEIVHNQRANCVTTTPSGSFETKFSDGTIVENLNGNIIKFASGGQQREISYHESSQGKDTIITDGFNHRTYRLSNDGKTRDKKIWEVFEENGLPATGGDGKELTYEGQAALSQSGELTFTSSHKIDTIRLDGSETATIKNSKNNSTIARDKDRVLVRTSDGSLREYKLENGQPISESVTKDGITEVWRRTPSRSFGANDWIKEGSNPPEFRLGNGIITQDGEFHFRHHGAEFESGGRTRIAKTDGTTEILFPLWSGETRKLVYGDPANANELTHYEVIAANTGTITKWRKVPGKDQFRCGNFIFNGNVTLEDGNWTIANFDERTKTTRTISGRTLIQNFNNNTETEVSKGELTRLKRGDQEAIFKRDQDGNVQEVFDSTRNIRLTKQENGSWTSAALDNLKAFKQLATKSIIKVEINNESGDYALVGEDRMRHRLNFDGTEERLGSMAELRRRIENNAMLSFLQKRRLLEDYLPGIEKRDITGKAGAEADREKTEAIYQLCRLLDKPSELAYKPEERAKMLEQTAFHLSAPHFFQQKGETCTVTNVGLSLLYESPGDFARVIAEVGTTGKFRSADGTYIVPPRQDISEALRDQIFPLNPYDPGASGVSCMFALTTGNLHWQRQTKGPTWNQVSLGNISYHQSGGEQLVHYVSGIGVPLTDFSRNIIASPHLSETAIMDIYRQISGKPEKNRLIFHKSRTNQTDQSTAVVTRPEEIHELLHTGQHAAIMTIHTSNPPFYYESGAGAEPGAGGPGGGWHVITIVAYQPAYKDADKRIVDLDKSKVYFDNTWNPGTADHINIGRGLSLSTLFAATIKPTLKAAAR